MLEGEISEALTRSRLRPCIERVKPILEYPVSKTKRQLRRFLGMLGWYSRFIEKESEIKLPLLKLIKKTQAWQCSAEQQAAFDKIKLARTRAPVLARPDFSLEFTVQYDASNDSLGPYFHKNSRMGKIQLYRYIPYYRVPRETIQPWRRSASRSLPGLPGRIK